MEWKEISVLLLLQPMKAWLNFHKYSIHSRVISEEIITISTFFFISFQFILASLTYLFDREKFEI